MPRSRRGRRDDATALRRVPADGAGLPAGAGQRPAATPDSARPVDRATPRDPGCARGPEAARGTPRIDRGGSGAPVDGSVPACRRPARESRLCSARSAWLLTQQCPQAHTRLVYLGLRRPFSDPENLGDLLVLEAFDIVQHEGRPAPLRQLTESAL